MLRRVFAAAALATLIASPAAAQSGYRVIVNTANPVSSIPKGKMWRLFLEKAVWDNGQAVTPVDLLPSSPIREVFSRDALGLPASGVADTWRRVADAGGNAPPAVASDREVLAYVRLKPGAIGYVSLDADVEGVKVVFVANAAHTAQADAMPPMAGGRPVPLPEKIVHVQPVYPAIARGARVQGTVVVEVVVGAGGDVEQTHVVRSIPILDEAAVSAVRRWKYKPTVVNGAAVPVTMAVRVTFTL
jgi:TonB family protein